MTKKYFEIAPPDVMGPFRIGMRRKDIWEKKRSPVESYYPNKFSESRSDDFRQLGMHFHYDASDLCCQITAFLINNPNVVFVFRGVELEGILMNDVEKILQEIGMEYEENDFGYHCRSFRVEFGAYNYGDGNVPLEYVFIYSVHPRE